MPGGKGNIKSVDGKPFTKENQPENRGRKKKLPALDELMASVLGAEDGKVDSSKAKELLEAMYKKALKGDVQAAALLMNRGYGMPKQGLELTGKDGAPLLAGKLTADNVQKLIDIVSDAKSESE